jgi:hypothetical protein
VPLNRQSIPLNKSAVLINTPLQVAAVAYLIFRAIDLSYPKLACPDG